MTKEFTPNPYIAEQHKNDQETPDMFFDYYGDLNDKDSLAYEVDEKTKKRWIDIVFEVERNAEGVITRAEIKDPDADRRFKVMRSRIGSPRAKKVIDAALDNLVNGPRKFRPQPKERVVSKEVELNEYEDFIDYIGDYFRDPDNKWLNSQVIKWNLEKVGEDKAGEKTFKLSVNFDNNRGKKGRERTVFTGTRTKIIEALDEELGYHEPHLRVVGDEE